MIVKLDEDWIKIMEKRNVVGLESFRFAVVNAENNNVVSLHKSAKEAEWQAESENEYFAQNAIKAKFEAVEILDKIGYKRY